MRSSLLLLFATITLNSCSQTSPSVNYPVAGDKTVGGACEGCEAIFECPVPFDRLDATTDLPDSKEKNNRLLVRGRVYRPDGQPAAGVVLYVYHTDQSGHYPVKGNEKGWDKRHGYLRGWIKTNEAGEYSFNTQLPAAYPGRNDPAHIHITLKETGKTAYWIDEFLFDHDPLLTTAARKKCLDRGGTGIMRLTFHENGSATGIRDIYLGKNIPDYE